MPPRIQEKMESFFGASFSDVRIHVGPQAGSIGALAFTQGTNIYFAPGQYSPDTAHGQQLLGHELTHVVQQRSGRVRNPFASGVAVVQDQALEAEADRMGRRASSHQVPVQAKRAASRQANSVGQVARPSVAEQGSKVTQPSMTRKPSSGPRPSAHAANGSFAAVQRKTAPLGQAPRANGLTTSKRTARPGSKVVQPYTTYWKIKNWGGLGRPMRVSDDGKMAVPDSAIFEGTKILYLTADVITAANQSLTDSRSPYQLDQTADSIRGRKPWTARTYQTLYRVSPRDTRNAGGGLGVQGGTGANLRTLENCSAHGLDSMGIGVDATAQGLSTREFRINVSSNGQSVRNTGSSFHATDSDIVAKQRIMEAIHRDKHNLAADAPVARDDARNTYAGLTKAERRRYAMQFGMNEYALPQVGDGIEALRTFGNFTGFPMHFAAVVARSGNDYVTLENWAKSSHERTNGDTLTASSAWYFRMYGVLKTGTFWDEDQSYSGEHAAEGSIADRSHMMGLVNRNVAKT